MLFLDSHHEYIYIYACVYVCVCVFDKIYSLNTFQRKKNYSQCHFLNYYCIEIRIETTTAVYFGNVMLLVFSLDENEVIITGVRNCQLITVSKDIYEAAIAEGTQSTKEIKSNGQVELVTEQRVVCPVNGKATPSTGTRQRINVIVKGSPTSLTSALFERTDRFGKHQEQAYRDIFLLTYRTFLMPGR